MKRKSSLRLAALLPIARAGMMCRFALVLVAALAFGTSPASAQRKNHLISQLESGGVAIGTLATSLTPLATYQQLRAVPGLDWILVDMEHGPLDLSQVRNIVGALRAADGSFPVAPIFRIAANCSEVDKNQWQFKQMLDGGAFGVIPPHCDDRKDVLNAAIAMRYPPFKNDAAPFPRGVRGAGGAPAAWNMTFAQYAQVADLWPLDPQGELLLMPLLESREVIRQLDSIMNVPGVGALFIGTGDLHADAGYAGQGGQPEVEEYVQLALAKAQRRGMPIGVPAGPADAQLRLDQGFRLLILGAPTPAELGALISTLRR